MLPLDTPDLPTTGAAFAAVLAQGIDRLLRPSEGRVRVQCVGEYTSEPDVRIADLRIDATGLRVHLDDWAVPEASGAARPVTLAHARFDAAPAYVQDVPVTAFAEVNNLPAQLQQRGGQWWLEADDRPSHHLTGEVVISALITDIEQAVKEWTGESLASVGFTLTDLQLQVESPTSRSLQLHLGVSVRRGIVKGTVTGSAKVAVDENMVVTLSGVELSSPNTLIRLALGAYRGRLAAWEGREIDISGYTFGGAGIQDVALNVSGNRVGVRGKLWHDHTHLKRS